MTKGEQVVLGKAAKKLQECLNVDGVLMSLVSADVITFPESQDVTGSEMEEGEWEYTPFKGLILLGLDELLPAVSLPPIDIEATKKAILLESAAHSTTANVPPYLRFKSSDDLKIHDELKIQDVQCVPDEVDQLVVNGGLLGREIDFYDYNPDRRKARILMINNIKFRDAPDRLGAEKDKESLGILCGTVFPGIKPEYYQNMKAHDMEKVLKGFAKSVSDSKAADVQAIFIFIMTHGHDADILGTDGESIPLLDVFKMFSPDACPALSGKPKVFFIQACRGDIFDIAAIISDQHDGIGGSKSKNEKISQLDDFLVAFSSGWGTYSLRNAVDGSYFIQVLKLVLEHNWSKGKGIEKVLKKVQIVMRHVRQNRCLFTEPGVKQEVAQSPGYYSHLSKELILVPA